ncbi:MAG: hypothetical protein HOK72_07015 [Flavobacteriales bacterium]|nr:hypothetical protein [Flavobacteriales bacterium]|tara:strand:- start:307 stop:528 length:222 start_codon:yes stop_codon:yes gene_type:complete
MGRPPTKPKQLRDGWYIEVRNKGAGSGIKIVRESKEQMMMAVEEYRRTKQVIILGESKNAKFLSKAKHIEKDK